MSQSPANKKQRKATAVCRTFQASDDISEHGDCQAADHIVAFLGEAHI